MLNWLRRKWRGIEKIEKEVVLLEDFEQMQKRKDGKYNLLQKENKTNRNLYLTEQKSHNVTHDKLRELKDKLEEKNEIIQEKILEVSRLATIYESVDQKPIQCKIFKSTKFKTRQSCFRIVVELDGEGVLLSFVDAPDTLDEAILLCQEIFKGRNKVEITYGS